MGQGKSKKAKGKSNYRTPLPFLLGDASCAFVTVGGAGVHKRIDVLAVALRAGMTVFDLEEMELAYAPQYGSAKAPINIAGFVADGLLRGDHPQVDVEAVLAAPASECEAVVDESGHRQHENPRCREWRGRRRPTILLLVRTLCLLPILLWLPLEGIVATRP